MGRHPRAGGRRRRRRAGSTSRTGDDISGAFPDMLDALDFEGALDGELLVAPRRTARSPRFADLQQRLNRKTVTPKQLRRYPAHIRAYDLLQIGGRGPARRCPSPSAATALEAFVGAARPRRASTSRRCCRSRLGRARRACAPRRRDPVIEGVMLKRARLALRPGRPEGPVVQVEARPAC